MKNSQDNDEGEAISNREVLGASSTSSGMGIGGRYDGACPNCEDFEDFKDGHCHFGMKTCICKALGEYCYSDFPEAYNFWFVSIFLVDTFLMLLSLKYSVEIAKVKWAKHRDKDSWRKSSAGRSRQRLTAMESIIFLTFFGSFMRWIWIICQVNGRHESVILAPIILDSFLLKCPQVLWLCAFFHLSLVWKRLGDQSQQMTKRQSSKSAYERLAVKVFALNILLLGVILPVYIVGLIYSPPLAAYADYFIFLMCLLCTVVGSKFGYSLCKELDKTVTGKKIIPTIKWTIGIGSCAAWVVVVYGLTYKMSLMKDGTEALGLAYSFIVHQFAETSVVIALLLTKINADREKKGSIGSTVKRAFNVSETGNASTMTMKTTKSTAGQQKSQIQSVMEVNEDEEEDDEDIAPSGEVETGNPIGVDNKKQNVV